MISHKPLKSISHNFAHSFISLMNYMHNDYLLGHLLRQARKTGLNKLTIDILTNSAEPKELLTAPIETSIKHYRLWFPNFVKDSGSTMDYVSSAIMTIEFDLGKTRPFSHDKTFIESPFVCEMVIIDDRGKEYKQAHSGWWFPESNS